MQWWVESQAERDSVQDWKRPVGLDWQVLDLAPGHSLQGTLTIE